jgi:hypothetical protein
MATLTNKTDEIAALETLREDLAKYEKSLIEKKDSPEKVKQSIKIKIADIRKQIREGKTTDREVTAKQLADSLLRSRKKFLEMSKKDFNGVLRQLAKKPEYAFLKGMTRQEVIDDIQRKAKPVGWRFKGRENFKTPTTQQVRRGRANGMVYYENRANRADVSQTKQLEKGGYANAENPTHVLHIDGYNYYLVKIDSTHFYMSNSPDFRGSAHHVGQHKGEPYYEEVREWLKTTRMAKGGSTYAEGGGEISVYGSNGKYFLKRSGTTYGEPYNTKKEAEFWARLVNKGDYKLTNQGVEYIEEKDRFAKGGSLKGHGLAIGDEILNVYRDDVYVYNRGVVYMINLSNGKRTMTKMSKNDAISTFENGGSVSMSMSQLQAMREADFDFDNDEDDSYDDGVTRHYFEDEAYSYEDGGEVDIDDLNIPVHYTMFEDEMYEYGKGGRVSKGEMVWGKLSQSKRMEFLNKHFTPQITPRSQEMLVAKNWNFLPKNVKIKFEAIYANVENY